MTAPLTTADLLAEGTAHLSQVLELPQLDAELLLAHSLGIARVRLKSHPEEPHSASERAGYLQLIHRRAGGEPLAYITGLRGFWTLQLQVDAAVLVPRPETELLVERALTLWTAAAAEVLDLGTGSGAIALAVASERPGWRVLASDACARALAVAGANAARLHLANVQFAQGDWFAPLHSRGFDLILSNPPYIAAADPALASLQFEPLAALSPGADALAALRTIAREAPAHLRQGGWLILEHGATQAQAVRDELVACGFISVRSHRDLGGHERVTEGQHFPKEAFHDPIPDHPGRFHHRAPPQGGAEDSGELPALRARGVL